MGSNPIARLESRLQIFTYITALTLWVNCPAASRVLPLSSGYAYAKKNIAFEDFPELKEIVIQHSIKNYIIVDIPYSFSR